jgi:hypothetical protein
MDDLLERLRAENPVPDCGALEIEAVWSKLGRRPPRRSPHVLAILFAVSVPVAVVVAVLLAVGAHRAPSRAGGVAAHPRSRCMSARRNVADPRLVALLAVLRRPPGPAELTPTACGIAERAIDPRLVPSLGNTAGPKPTAVRYVGRALLGGSVYIYTLPGLPRSLAFRGLPSNSSLGQTATRAAACLLIVGGAPNGDLNACVSPAALEHPGGFEASQIYPSQTPRSFMAGIVRDGIAAVAVYDRGRRTMVVPVHDNVVQLIVPHSAPAAVYMHLVFLGADGLPVHPQ